MSRSIMRLMVFTLAMLCMGRPVRAQYGWGGWGGGATTLQGSMARGMGVYAYGAGVYNEQTAEARSINANTAMQVNQYMYEVNKNNAQHYYARSAAQQKQVDATGRTIYSRVHDNPSPGDVHRGDALNAVLNDLTNPQVYTQAVQQASQTIESEIVKNIPFEYAANMVTAALADLNAQGAPDVLLTTPDFKEEREKLKVAAAQAHAEAEARGEVSAETLANCRAAIKALQLKVDAVVPQGSHPRAEADNFLKALYGLTKMMKSPAIGQFLTELDKLPTTSLGHLVTFMHTFNLRFGPAATPQQEAAYDQLYPRLAALRDQVNAPDSAPFATPTNPSKPQQITPLFSGMQMKTLQSEAPAPAPPTPQP